MSLRKEDFHRWHALGWWGRYKKRKLYSGKTYAWAYKNLEWDEYTFFVLSNCDRYISSGAGGLMPDIMRTPVKDRDRVRESRRVAMEMTMERLEKEGLV